MVAGRARKPSKRALEAQGLDQSVSKPIAHKKQRSQGSKAGSSAEHSAASADDGQRQGKLLQLSDFPVELIYKIFEHTDHQTLYSLTRVNKMFRELILSPRYDETWKRAEEELGIDKLNERMTRLQLAHLMWGKECSFCGTRAWTQRLWYLKRIMCKTCIKEETVPPSRFGSHASHKYTRYSVDKSSRQLISFIEWVDENFHDIDNDYYEQGYDEWEDTRDNFATRVENICRDRRKDAALLEQAEQKHLANEEARKESLRDARKATIARLLRERHGWTEEDFTATDWQDSTPKYVKTLSGLTDQEFESMVPKLEAWRKRQYKALAAKGKAKESAQDEGNDVQASNADIIEPQANEQADSNPAEPKTIADVPTGTETVEKQGKETLQATSS